MTREDRHELHNLAPHSEITPDQFQLIVNFFCEQARINTFSVEDRKPYVVINRANYGHPSLAAIEFEGSPPCLRIIYGDISYITKFIILGARKIASTNGYISLIEKLIGIIIFRLTGEKL